MYPNGDTNYLPSQSDYYTVTVNGITSQLTASDYPNPSDVSVEDPTTVTFSATVSNPAGTGGPTPTGTVTLKDNTGLTYNSCTLNGTGSCTFDFDGNMFPIPDNETGDENFTFTMTASYSGDQSYSRASFSFTQTVECNTYDDVNDYIEYEDVYDPYDYYYYTNWWEIEDTITYNCQGIEISDDQQVLDSGSDSCEWSDYQTSCDGYYLWESDEYWCNDVGQDNYYWTDWYVIDYCGLGL